MGTLEGGVVPRGSETILLVDADPEARKLGAFMLGRRGYTVLEARSTAEALQIFESGEAEVDLLLTEVLLPPKSVLKPAGIDLATRLLAERPELRVLYMSNTDYHRSVRPFLQKPFTMRMVAEKVREALDAGQARAAGAVAV